MIPSGGEGEGAGPFASVDWSTVFRPETPLLEIVVRGSVTYLALFVLLRLVLKRQSAGMGVTDLLVVVLIADAAQNAMGDDYRSVPDGVLLVAVILFWAFALDAVGYYVPALQRLVQPGRLPLISEGRMIRRNMRKEFVTPDELETQLREQGVEDVEAVRAAYMESDGRVSVLTYDEQRRRPRRRRAL